MLAPQGKSRDNMLSLISNALVNAIVDVIERRTSAIDYVNDYVNDYVSECVDCREAALIAKRSLGDDPGA